MFTPRTFGKYHLLEKIAVGGMAELFKAKIVGAAGFEKHMVLKQILPQYAQDENFVKMFIDEAKIAVSLSHGNVVPIFELGNIDGTYFIAMEYIDGRNLGQIMERADQAQTPIPSPIALFIAMEICKGLDYAHRKTGRGGQPLHIVHRDISPQNILVSFDGEVKIVDFGIAKAIYSSQTTKAGVIKGKFGYMSPEQARGLTLDSRTDVFSAGILLFEMLTGSRLFSADSEVETLENVRTARVPSPSRLNPGIPPMLDKIVFKALAKDPKDRYQSADDLHKALAKFVYSQGWDVSQNALARTMGEMFPVETRNGARAASSVSDDCQGQAAPQEEVKEPPMADPKDSNPTPEDDATRRVSMEDVMKEPEAPAKQKKSAPSLVGPPELETLLQDPDVAPAKTAEPEKREEPAAPPAVPQARKPVPEPAVLDAPREAEVPAPPPPDERTSPGFELAKLVPDKEPSGVLQAADELDLGDAELLMARPPSSPTQGNIPPPAVDQPPPQKRSVIVPVLVVTIVALIGVIGLLLGKFGVTLSPAEKKRIAAAKQRKLIEERDKNAPIYGRVQVSIEPVAVDFYWNGQRHPGSPTKHVQIRDLDIKKTYKVKLVPLKKPDEKSLMWYPKELTIGAKDWKIEQGIHVYRLHTHLDPTPENKEGIEKAEERRKAIEELKRKIGRVGMSK